jgi:CRP-like cAMP-binding protein
MICGSFQQKFLNKEEPLLIAGKKFKNIVFVVEGILRVFIIDKEGNEVVKNFIEPTIFSPTWKVLKRIKILLLMSVL